MEACFFLSRLLLIFRNILVEEVDDFTIETFLKIKCIVVIKQY